MNSLSNSSGSKQPRIPTNAKAIRARKCSTPPIVAAFPLALLSLLPLDLGASCDDYFQFKLDTRKQDRSVIKIAAGDLENEKVDPDYGTGFLIDRGAQHLYHSLSRCKEECRRQ